MNRNENTRTLHLVDIENALGGAVATADEVRAFWRAYREFAVGVGEDDHVVVASSSIMAKVAWFALPQAGIQRRVKDGKDGADHALLESVDLDRDAARFGRLVITSGDHIFAPLARDARAAGMRVHQVIGNGTPSRELLSACPTRTWLRPAALRAMRDQ